MSALSSRKSIFSSDTEDFLKLFLPALLIIPLIFYQNLEWFAWSGIIFLSVMDISHVFSTGIEAYFDPEERIKRKTLVLTAIGISIALFIVTFFAPYAQNIFFYSIIFHNMRQGLGLTLIYEKKAESHRLSPRLLKYIYYFFTLMPVVIFHFKRIYVDFGPLEAFYFVVPLEKFFFFDQSLLMNAVQMSEGLYLALMALTFIYLFVKVEIRTVLCLLFFSGIYTFSYIGTKNLLFSSLFLMASHAVPYLFLIHKRTKDLSQAPLMRRFPALILLGTVILGACYYFFFYRNIGEVTLMSPMAKFFVITPSYIHYAFDGHVWTKNNPRFLKFLRE